MGRRWPKMQMIGERFVRYLDYNCSGWSSLGPLGHEQNTLSGVKL